MELERRAIIQNIFYYLCFVYKVCGLRENEGVMKTQLKQTQWYGSPNQKKEDRLRLEVQSQASTPACNHPGSERYRPRQSTFRLELPQTRPLRLSTDS